MNGTLYAFLLSLTALLFIGLAFYGWKQRHLPGAKAFSLAAVLLAAWPLAQAIDVFSSDLIFKIWLMKLRVPPPYIAATVWLFMIAQLTEQVKRIKWWHIAITLLPAMLLTFLLIIDSPIFRYGYFIDHSGAFPILRWATTPLSYFFSLYATVAYLFPLTLLRGSSQNTRLLSRQQIAVLGASIIFPVAITVLFQFNISLVPGFNLTPIAQSVVGLLIAGIIFHYPVFQVKPFAHTVLFEQMSDAMIVLDANQHIIDINTSAHQLIGKPTMKVLGHPMEDLLTEWNTLINKLQDRREIGTEISLKQHPLRQFEVKLTKLQDHNDKIMGYLCVFREITANKEAAELIKQSEEKFRQLYTNNPLMLFTLATDGTVLAVNPTAVTQMGYSENEMIGHSVLNVFHPEDQANVVKSLQEYLVDFVQTAPWQFRKVTKDGKIIWVSETLQTFRDRNGDLQVLVACKDVTHRKLAEETLRKAQTELEVRVLERTTALTLANSSLEHEIEERRKAEADLRESEARLRAVVESSPNGIVTTDDHGNITMVNTQIETLFGYRRNELIGQPLGRLLPTRSPIKNTNQHDFIPVELKEYLVQSDGEAFGIRKNGKSFPMEVVLNEIESRPGTSVLVTMRDITARKQEEEQQQKLQIQLQHSQKLESLGVLAGGIAHDFNNLLTSILGYADLAANQLAPDTLAHRFIEQSMQGAKQAAQLTNQMLAYSGKGRFVIEAINLSNIVEEMARLLQVSISKKCTLQYDFDPDLPTIEADEAQIRQIIMNLVINASDAMGERNGIITVSTETVTCDRTYLTQTYLDENLPEGTYAVLEVSDNGCGMSEQTRLKIFDPFFTTKFTGRGLGLAAVLGIVRGHRGAIKIYSEPGKGTTFKVLFPITDQPAVTQQTQPAKPAEWQGEGWVLVVDDEKTLREVCADMLIAKGFNVLTAADGSEAVEIFRQKADLIRLVLLDLTMPRLDGEETFRELQRIRKDVKAILTSGYNEQTISSRFAGKGLAGFIQKPYTLRDLLKLMQNVLENDPNMSTSKENSAAV